ncbi:unnamed protein product, partial [Anisakis simplex]|uniref:Transposase n=1 Tax=Anisakis simplex TaxID=6269 RepID=A0A0M3JKE4_ANISI
MGIRNESISCIMAGVYMRKKANCLPEAFTTLVYTP